MARSRWTFGRCGEIRKPPNRRSRICPEHVACDDHFHHLRRTLGDAVAALLPPEFLDRQIGGERDAAVDLHAAIGHPESHLVGVGLADISLHPRVLSRLYFTGGLINHQSRGVQLDITVNQHELDRLPFRQRFAEGHALLGITRRHLEAAFGDAKGTRAMLDAPDADPLLAELKSLAFRAYSICGRNANIVEHDFAGTVAHHGFVSGRDFDTRCVHIHQEARDAAARAFGAVGCRHDLREVGLVGVTDEAFHAVDDVKITVTYCGGAHRAGI